jgi:CRP/FNR family transcriptional regulator, cyclic AMP receptor protein
MRVRDAHPAGVAHRGDVEVAAEGELQRARRDPDRVRQIIDGELEAGPGVDERRRAQEGLGKRSRPRDRSAGGPGACFPRPPGLREPGSVSRLHESGTIRLGPPLAGQDVVWQQWHLEASYVKAEPSANTHPHHSPTRSLLEIVPGLDGPLEEEQRRFVSRFRVPLHTAFEGRFDLAAVLGQSDAFAVVIADGMLARTLALGSHAGLQLLGPGDLISRPGENGSDLVVQTGLLARGLVRYATLDDRALALIQRFPRLHEGWQMRVDDQQQRLIAQLLICQLPRIEDRVLAMMWLLAETWGRVTQNGTVLAVKLTHDMIGLLVGARRPTVTLALSALEERGALVRRADDWLIVERPPEPGSGEIRVSGLPRPATGRGISPWSSPALTAASESTLQAIRMVRAQRAETIERSREIVASAGATARHSRRLAELAELRRSARDRLHHEDDAGDLPATLDGSERQTDDPAGERPATPVDRLQR